MRASVLVVFLVLTVVFSTPSPAQDLDPETLKRGIESTVFIKSERVFRGLYFPGFGSGFFVHPNGYVLTNWHVVADQIEARLYGEKREIKTKVLSLEVVINSGLPNERVIPAKVVARDRSRDLALLHVPVQPSAWVAITSPPQAELAQPIWLVGYPLGNMLSSGLEDGSMTSEEIPNPSVSINRGMVTSLRRNTDGKLRALQIDAPVNPGNSGGPLFDHQGRVIGVVNSKIMGAEGLGFAIAPTLLGEFASKESARVKFEPKSVYRSPARPIRVTVEPMLADFESSKGTVRLHADGMAPIDLILEKDGAVWSAEIPIPERGPDDPDPDDYFVDLTFTRSDDSVVMQRKFRLRSATAGLNVYSQRDPGKMLEDRRSYSNEMAISDYTKSGSVSGEKTRSLSDVAKNVKLQRSASGSIVIDDHTLAQLNSPLERYFSQERYDQIESAGERALARDYDIVAWTRSEIESRLRGIGTYLDHSDYRTRNAARQADRELRKLQPEVEAGFEALQQRIRHTKLVFCHDREKWFYSHSYPCEAPEFP